MPQPDEPARKPEEFTLVEPYAAQEWKSYFDLRWRVLRQPWGQPRGSERDDFDAKSFHLMLREPGGAAAAVGRLHLNSPSEAQVRYMAVEEGCARRGIGGRILEELESRARAAGRTRMILNSRESAVPFYRKHGYELMDQTGTLFGTLLHWRMRKNL